ncbi:GNAT family N-acetyltransferase [Massilia sp. KIM]|uniref:GNAT family N-acetyltransferase n=1 Tax=Massilia sp. KIM TaxID=1955422 RepID=UPI0009901173|nr:GNAT family N-acetyltransferase [Massilia sp. KIM]OON64219.1 GNAT family N-acetyltransferase [Massilia sp. KIM]
MAASLIRQAGLGDLPLVAPLFDAYRQFYGKPADPALAASFLRERLERDESTIFLATDADGRGIGFVQLYPSFSSVSAGRIYVLNDLFVAPAARGAAVGRGLLQAAADFGRQRGALRLVLSTAKTNTRAQALYTSAGWVRDEDYFEYTLALRT